MALVRGSKNVEDYHKLTQIQFLTQSLEQSDVRGDKHVACLKKGMSYLKEHLK
jgi:hypothetical protein